MIQATCARLACRAFGLKMVFNVGQTMCAPDDDVHRSAQELPGFAVMVTGSLGWPAGHGDASRPHTSVPLHPAVERMLLVSPANGLILARLATHPPLSERIRRVYGRLLPPLRCQRDDRSRSRPAGLFQER